MLGQTLIVFGLLSGILSLSMYYFTYKGYENTFKVARIAYNIQAAFILFAALYLLKAIFNHEFYFSYVYEYSSTDLSLGLLLSSFWAGQEGSFLLWLLFASIIGMFIQKSFDSDEKYEASVMIFYTLGLIFLNLLIFPGLKDPFETLFTGANYISANLINPNLLQLPAIQNYIFTNPNNPGEFIKFGPELKATLESLGISPVEFLVQGRGLNPLLQNFWMIIHPPILFLGFAMASIPFSFGMSALLRNEYKTWVKPTLPWLIIGMGVLGAGIMIGGYWAYGVLGWGGYWGWDPVENSSLVPWIIGVALLHTLLIQKKYQSVGKPKYLRTNLTLAVLTYVFVIYSTFLTRSGILSDASVHSFVEPGMLTYTALIAFMVFFVLIGGVFIIKRWNYLNDLSESVDGFLNRENALFYGASILLGMAIIITVGTSSPIFKTAVDISFYNIMNKPLVILAAFILGVSLFLGWNKTQKDVIFKQASVSFGISAVISLIIFFTTDLTGVLNFLFLFSAFFGLTTNILFFTKNLRNGFLFTGGQITHLGTAILLIGIALNGNLLTKTQVELPKGKKITLGDLTVRYIGYTPIENGSKFAFGVEFTEGDKAFIASPVMYNSDYNGSLMREPDIIEGVFKDIYISPLGLDVGEDELGKEVVLKKGETIQVDSLNFTFEKFIFSEDHLKNMSEGKDFSIGAKILVDNGSQKYEAVTYMKNIDKKNTYVADTLSEAGLIIKMVKMDAAGSVLVSINSLEEKTEYKPEVLSAEISLEPFISLVWLGIFLLTLGFMVSGYRRFQH